MYCILSFVRSTLVCSFPLCHSPIIHLPVWKLLPSGTFHSHKIPVLYVVSKSSRYKHAMYERVEYYRKIACRMTEVSPPSFFFAGVPDFHPKSVDVWSEETCQNRPLERGRILWARSRRECSSSHLQIFRRLMWQLAPYWSFVYTRFVLTRLCDARSFSLQADILQGRDLVITTYGTLVSDYADGSKKGPLYSTKVTDFQPSCQVHQGSFRCT